MPPDCCHEFHDKNGLFFETHKIVIGKQTNDPLIAYEVSKVVIAMILGHCVTGTCYELEDEPLPSFLLPTSTPPITQKSLRSSSVVASMYPSITCSWCLVLYWDNVNLPRSSIKK